MRPFRFLILSTLAAALTGGTFGKTMELLNVSYDPTRELYTDFNAAFAKYWKGKTGDDVIVKQSHGGSGAQARSVIDGLQADVVTLALWPPTIDALHEHGDLPFLPIGKGACRTIPRPTPARSCFWSEKEIPKPSRIGATPSIPASRSSCPTPKPRAARAGPTSPPGGTPSANMVPRTRPGNSFPSFTGTCRCSIRAPAARPPRSCNGGSGMSFSPGRTRPSSRSRNSARDKFEVSFVVPSVSILAEPPAALVDRVAKRKGTVLAATAYLRFLYSDEGQNIAGRNYYRPRNPKIAARTPVSFRNCSFLRSTKFSSAAGPRRKRPIFADGGVFDQIYQK